MLLKVPVVRRIAIIRAMNPNGKPSNPFVQFLGLIFGFVVFLAAVLLGGIVLAAIIGFILIAVMIVYVRVWWLTRKAAGSRQQENYVEAEYQVIDSEDDDAQR